MQVNPYCIWWIGCTFLVPAHLGSPGKRAVKWVCVCVSGSCLPSINNDTDLMKISSSILAVRATVLDCVM